MATAMLGALYLASDYVILNRFIALERLNTQETMNVVREGFNDDLEKLDRSNSDLSVYDGTWEAMAAKNGAKIKEFIYSLLADSKGGWQAQQMIQYVIFTDAAGRVVWATGYDAARDRASDGAGGSAGACARGGCAAEISNSARQAGRRD